MTTGERELLPCPFCGGEAHIVRVGSRRQSSIIECVSCGCRHESCDEGGNCGDGWNRRAIPQARAGERVPPSACSGCHTSAECAAERRCLLAAPIAQPAEQARKPKWELCAACDNTITCITAQKCQRTAEPVAQPVADAPTIWTHADGGRYTVVSIDAPMKLDGGTWQGSYVVYRSLTDGKVYITNRVRFEQRFRPVDRHRPQEQNHD